MSVLAQSLVTPSEAPLAGLPAAIREVPNAACIVSCACDGDVVAFAATSVASLSPDPPTLMIGLDRASLYRPILESAVLFGVNVLSSDQQEAAVAVAGGGLAIAQRQNDLRWLASDGGAPLLVGALVAFDCTIDEIIERFGRMILFGRVQAVSHGRETGALVRWRGAYEQLGWSLEQAVNAVGVAQRPRDDRIWP